MCAQGFCIKQFDSLEEAKKAVRLFSSLGLGVGIGQEQQAIKKSHRAFEALDDDDLNWPNVEKWTFLALLSVTTFAQMLIVGVIVVAWVALVLSMVAWGVTLALSGFFSAILSILVFAIVLSLCGLTWLGYKFLVGGYPERQTFLLDQVESEKLNQIVSELAEQYEVELPDGIVVNNEADVRILPAGTIFDALRGRYMLVIGLPLAKCVRVQELIALLSFAFANVTHRYLAFAYFTQYAVKSFIQLRLTVKGQFELSIEDRHAKSTYWLEQIIFATVIGLVRRYRACLGYYLELFTQLNKPVSLILLKRNLFFEQFVLNEKSIAKLAAKISAVCRAREMAHTMNQLAWSQRLLADDKSELTELIWSKRAVNLPEGLFKHDGGKAFYQIDHPIRVSQQMFSSNAKTIDLQRLDMEFLGATQSIFEDFDTLSEEVTLESYLDCYVEGVNEELSRPLGYGEVPERWVVPAKQIELFVNYLIDIEQHVKDYFGFPFSHRLMEFDDPLNPDLLKMDLQSVIDWIRERLISYREEQANIELVQHDMKRKKIATVFHHASLPITAAKIAEGSKYNYATGGKNSTGELSALGSKKGIEAILVSREYEEAFENLSVKIHLLDRMVYRRIVLTIEEMTGSEKRNAQHLLTATKQIVELSASMEKVDQCLAVMQALLTVKPKILLRKTGKPLAEQAKICRDNLAKIIHKSSEITLYNQEFEPIETLSEVIEQLNAKAFHALSPVELITYSSRWQSKIRYYYADQLGRLVKLCSGAEDRLDITPLKIVQKKPSSAPVAKSGQFSA